MCLADPWMSVFLDPRARKIEIDCPVLTYGEAVVHLPRRFAQQSPAPTLIRWDCGWRSPSSPLEVRAGSSVALEKVPYLPGAPLRVVATRQGTESFTAAGTWPFREARLEIAPGRESVDLLLGLPPIFTQQRLLTPIGSVALPARESKAGVGVIELVVRGPDLEPAASAAVLVDGQVPTIDGRVAMTDRTGAVRLPALRAGRRRITVIGAGSIATALVDVVGQETVRKRITARSGGTLTIRVSDKMGNRLPFASALVVGPSGVRHLEVVDGVQFVSPRVDRFGEREYSGVECGTHTVRVVYAGFDAEKKIEIHDGRHHVLNFEFSLAK